MATAIQIENLSKYIGDLVLFEKVNLTLNQGEKAALIGLNGAGKTTLLNLINGGDAYDSGSISMDPTVKMAYLPQDPILDPEQTVMDVLFNSENELLGHIRDYEEALLTGDVKRIEQTGGEMDRLKLWDFDTRIKQMLTQLEITDFHQPIASLSGGQKKRIALAGTLLNDPDLLILDEPTNHLDLVIIEWIENYIQRSNMSLLMVTHDRFFLDRICNTIFEIDRKQVFKYHGNYSDFVEQRAQRIELERLEVEKAQNQLRKEEEWMRRMPKARGTKAKYRIDNYYSLKEKASKTRNDKNIKLNVQESRMGSKILVAKNLNFAWGDRYYVKDFNYIFTRFEKVGIIGSNGTGKSTFLQLLTQNLTPESGTIETGETIKFGYYRQDGLKFDENMRVLDAVTEIAETVVLGNNVRITASQFLTYFLFPHARQNDYIYKLSGGEKRRLYLCQVLMQNPNFLILDEPTNDLDIASLQVLEEYLAAFSGCVLVVSHDRFFMDNVVDHLFVFSGNGAIKDFPGNYSAYFEWKKKQEAEIRTGEKAKLKTEEPVKKAAEADSRPKKLTFNEKRELEQLELDMEQLEIEKNEVEQLLSSGTLNAGELTEKSQRLGTLIGKLDTMTDRWLELSERQ